MRIVDLSFPIRPHFRWRALSERVATHANGDPLQSTVMTLSCHAYTHVDAPLHYLADGRHIAEMPLDQWMGEAAVIDLTHLGPNGEVTAGDLDERARHVRRGDIVLLRTDWPKRTSVEDQRFWSEGPYTGPSACDWLIARGVKAVGYDYPPDRCIRDTVAGQRRKPARAEYTTHALFFPAGITVIEYLTNLDQVGAPRCRFLALPLKIDGADGSPVRAIALVG
ncbi:MAG: cyclase family protein [Candidatus Rokubacteria bacterium]|nr:cyclase family protein [Candidatus Rokubacteria bacterium]